MRLKKGSVKRQQKEISQKNSKLDELKSNLNRINKVIEYIYFYGDNITEFDVGAILRQTDQENQENQEIQSYRFEDVD